MREITWLESYSEYIPPVTIFREDIEGIYNILSSANEDVEIFTDKYQFDSIKELLNFKENIVKLEFRIKDPYINIKIDKWVNITLYQDTNIARGVIERIKLILVNRRKLFNTKVRVSIIPWVISYSFWFSSFLALKFFKEPVVTPLVTALFLVGIIIIIWDYYVNFRRKSSIRLCYKKESPSFWEDNKDRILIGIITTLFGSVATIIISKLF